MGVVWGQFRGHYYPHYYPLNYTLPCCYFINDRFTTKNKSKMAQSPKMVKSFSCSSSMMWMWPKAITLRKKVVYFAG